MPVIPHAFCIEPGCGGKVSFDEFKQIELELEFKKKRFTADFELLSFGHMGVRFEHYFDSNGIPIALGMREKISLIPGDFDSPSVWRLYVIDDIKPEVRFSLLSRVKRTIDNDDRVYRVKNCGREHFKSHDEFANYIKQQYIK